MVLVQQNKALSTLWVKKYGKSQHGFSATKQSIVYSVSQKNAHAHAHAAFFPKIRKKLCMDIFRIFVSYWLIFQISSLIYSAENLQ